MAEAVVDGTPMSRFFCHKCSIEIERLLPDYTCPQCASGFIEELESGGNDSSSSMDTSSEDFSDFFNDFDEFYDLAQAYGPESTDVMEVLRAQTRGPTSRRRFNWPRNNQRTRRSNSWNSGRRRTEAIPMSVENFIRDFIVNLSGASLNPPISQDGQPPAFNIRMFLGNLGDYAWGQNGLDAIVTQLLNQLDGTGPPPLPKKQIDEIPTTNVTQNHVDNKLQCSVCWEDFKLSEPVKRLPCQHLYHTPCIVPWLELHETCPICRQSLGDQTPEEENEDIVGPSLAALFRAANESNTSRTSSASSASSSSSGSNSSNNTTSEI